MTDPEVAELGRLRRLGERIALARVSQKISLEALAALARLDQKTVRTAISGRPVWESSLVAICNALNISVEDERKEVSVANEQFGSYNLDHYRDYVGFYFVYRRGFVEPKNILRTMYKIMWDDSNGERRLRFFETHRYIKNGKVKNYSQDGDVYIDNSKNIVQLLTVNKGDLRLISITRMQDQQKSMSGIVATNAHLSFFYQPSASAIFFAKIDSELSLEQMEHHIGPIYTDSKEYAVFDEILKDVEQNVGLFAISPQKSVADGDFSCGESKEGPYVNTH